MVTVSGNVAEFRFFHPRARQVFLVGEFNGWRQGELAMTREASGYWRAAASLPGGILVSGTAPTVSGIWTTPLSGLTLPCMDTTASSVSRPRSPALLPRAPTPVRRQHPEPSGRFLPPFLAGHAGGNDFRSWH
jgi:hypothetical protein